MKAARHSYKTAASAMEELDGLRLAMLRDPNEEAVHQFRVRYKRTRALFRMEGMSREGRNFRLRRPWKQVYQAAGMVRDSQLLLKLVQTEIGAGRLSGWLGKQLDDHLRSLGDLLETVDPGKEHFRRWQKKPDHDRYFREVLSTLHLYYRQPLYDEELHECRKILKDVLYNLEWLPLVGVEAGEVISRFPVTEADALQKKLGDYQDSVVQSSIIRQLAVLPGLEGEGELLESWITGAFRRQKELRSDLDKALEHFFHLHAP